MVSAKKTEEAIEATPQAAQDSDASAKAQKAVKSAEKKPIGKRTAAKRVAEAVEAAREGNLLLDSAVDTELYVKAAVENPVFLDLLVASLKSNSRRDRQMSSVVVTGIAKADASLLAERIPTLVSALSCAEAQTRWQVLEALYQLVPVDLAACKKAITKAEDCLYDDLSGTVRVTAFCLLCALGAQDSRTSKKVWPYLDEAIQCYHGDLEFQDMLNELVKFSTGSINSEVKAELAARMKFDAENGHGPLKRKARLIVDNCSPKK